MMKRYMEGELAPDAPKKSNEPLEFSGGYSGPKLGPDVEGKAKEVCLRNNQEYYRRQELAADIYA